MVVNMSRDDVVDMKDVDIEWVPTRWTLVCYRSCQCHSIAKGWI